MLSRERHETRPCCSGRIPMQSSARSILQFSNLRQTGYHFFTYFFFGDTHTGTGDQDGDAIAFTTDDTPEPGGLHLQFIMGDNQWRRLVIPGISLGNFETPTSGFSHAGRICVIASTGVLRTGGAVYMEN